MNKVVEKLPEELSKWTLVSRNGKLCMESGCSKVNWMCEDKLLIGVREFSRGIVEIAKMSST